MCDGAGEVVAGGPGVTQFKVGDRVASTFFQTWTGGRIPPDASKNSLGGQLDGVLAEYIALSQNGAIRIPDHLSFEEAATLPCAALTAWNALIETGGIKCRRNGRDPRHRRRIVFRHSLRQDARGLRFPHIEQRRQARARQGARRRLADQLQVDAGLGQGGAQAYRRRRRRSCRRGRRRQHAGEVDERGAAGRINLRHRLARRQLATINPRIINRKELHLHGVHVGSREMFNAMNRAV